MLLCVHFITIVHAHKITCTHLTQTECPTSGNVLSAISQKSTKRLNLSG